MTLSLIMATRNSLTRGSLPNIKSISGAVHDFGGSIQLVIVDDGSVDTSPEALSELAATHPRTCVYPSEQSVGPGGARNVGLQHARGDLIAFIDDDDDVDVSQIWEAAQSVLRAEVDVGCSPYSIVISEGHDRTDSVTDISYADVNDFASLLRPFPAVWRFLFRKSFLLRYKLEFPRLNYAEDLLFLLDVSVASPNFIVLDQVYYIHKMHAGSLSDNMAGLGREPLRVLDYLARFLVQPASDANVSRLAMTWSAKVAGRTLAQGSVMQRIRMVRYCVAHPRLLMNLASYAMDAQFRNGESSSSPSSTRMSRATEGT